MMRPSVIQSLPRVLFVTGTDTGVGKTIVTAALAVALESAGRTVAVYKPTQAGLEDGEADVEVVRRLAGAETHEGIRLRDPMAPVAAAQLAGVALPTAAEHVVAIRQLADDHDHTLVEGAGGILVQLDETGHTLADIASAIALSGGVATGSDVAAIVVCRAALGTLNHTELTLEALVRRDIAVLGLVIGCWPREPTAVDLSNREYLNRHRLPLLGSVPEESGCLSPAQFRAGVKDWLPVSSWARETA
jgi:dethiobiotin synthetase